MNLTTIRHKRYEDLTKGEVFYLRKKGILNGFGGAGQSWLARKLISCIVGDFDKAIPDKHDFGYWQGGDEARRIECDEKFYQAMLDDIRARYDTGIITKTGLVWKSFITLGAWLAIRWKGKKFFCYISK